MLKRIFGVSKSDVLQNIFTCYFNTIEIYSLYLKHFKLLMRHVLTIIGGVFMEIKFWGVRGSVPAPLTPKDYTEKLRKVLRLTKDVDISDNKKIDTFIESLPMYLQTTYGGNTSCITITTDEICLILDAGTGLRLLGNDIMSGKFVNPTKNKYHIFLSHLHWDHINGLPFFIPLHMENAEFNFYSVHKDYEKSLSLQQNLNFFPVSFESRPVKKQFHYLDDGSEFIIGGFKITPKKLNHPNDAYAFRITNKLGKTVVYATDGEYMEASKLKVFAEFYKDADVLIFDSQYSINNELTEKTGYGHSSSKIGIDIGIMANVGEIIFYHHNHDYTDKTIDIFFHDAKKYLKDNYPFSKLVINIACEGNEIKL